MGGDVERGNLGRGIVKMGSSVLTVLQYSLNENQTYCFGCEIFCRELKMLKNPRLLALSTSAKCKVQVLLKWAFTACMVFPTGIPSCSLFSLWLLELGLRQ